MPKQKTPLRSWPAISNWPQKYWAILLTAIPATYFLTAAPLLYFVMRMAPAIPDRLFWLFLILLMPVILMAADSVILGTIFECEMTVLTMVFGPPGPVSPPG